MWAWLGRGCRAQCWHLLTRGEGVERNADIRWPQMFFNIIWEHFQRSAKFCCHGGRGQTWYWHLPSGGIKIEKCRVTYDSFLEQIDWNIEILGGVVDWYSKIEVKIKRKKRLFIKTMQIAKCWENPGLWGMAIFNNIVRLMSCGRAYFIQGLNEHFWNFGNFLTFIFY